MPRGRYRKATPEEIADVLSAMAAKLPVNAIMRETGVGTSVLYKIIADYPIWSYYLGSRAAVLRKDEPNA